MGITHKITQCNILKCVMNASQNPIQILGYQISLNKSPTLSSSSFEDLRGLVCRAGFPTPCRHLSRHRGGSARQVQKDHFRPLTAIYTLLFKNVKGRKIKIKIVIVIASTQRHHAVNRHAFICYINSFLETADELET